MNCYHGITLLVGLAMAPTFTEANTLPNTSPPRIMVKGYDCTRPKRERSSAVPQHCVNWGSSMETTTNDEGQVYELLQLRLKVQFTGYVCSLQVSQSFRYCGIWSYEQEFIPPTIYERQELSPEECRRMIQYQKVELPGGSIVSVQAHGLTYADIVPEG